MKSNSLKAVISSNPIFAAAEVGDSLKFDRDKMQLLLFWRQNWGTSICDYLNATRFEDLLSSHFEAGYFLLPAW